MHGLSLCLVVFMPHWILATWQGACIIMNCWVKWLMLWLHIAFNWCSHKSEINVSGSAKCKPLQFPPWALFTCESKRGIRKEQVLLFRRRAGRGASWWIFSLWLMGCFHSSKSSLQRHIHKISSAAHSTTFSTVLASICIWFTAGGSDQWETSLKRPHISPIFVSWLFYVKFFCPVGAADPLTISLVEVLIFKSFLVLKFWLAEKIFTSCYLSDFPFWPPGPNTELLDPYWGLLWFVETSCSFLPDCEGQWRPKWVHQLSFLSTFVMCWCDKGGKDCLCFESNTQQWPWFSKILCSGMGLGHHKGLNQSQMYAKQALCSFLKNSYLWADRSYCGLSGLVRRANM